ncbi:MAG: hypothetical protein P8X91_09875, partial [Candidatus Bathyarchaeota archaeon]
GYADVIVGAPFYEDDPNQTAEGGAFVFLTFGFSFGSIDPRKFRVGILAQTSVLPYGIHVSTITEPSNWIQDFHGA